MTLSERLRAGMQIGAAVEAADALDAKDKRIAELEGAIRAWQVADSAFDDERVRPTERARQVLALDRAESKLRAALKDAGAS